MEMLLINFLLKINRFSHSSDMPWLWSGVYTTGFSVLIFWLTLNCLYRLYNAKSTTMLKLKPRDPLPWLSIRILCKCSNPMQIRKLCKENQYHKQRRKAKDNTGSTLQNFTWIWSKFIVYTGYIYKIWNQGRAIKQKKTNTRYNWGIS